MTWGSVGDRFEAPVPKQLQVDRERHRLLNAELASIFSHSNSTTGDSLIQPDRVQFQGVGDSIRLCSGWQDVGPVRWNPSCRSCTGSHVTALLHRQRGNVASEIDEGFCGLPKVRCHQCSLASTDLPVHRSRDTAVEPPDSKHNALRGFTADSTSHQKAITLRCGLFEIAAGAGSISCPAFDPLLLKNSSSAVHVLGSTTVHMQLVKLEAPMSLHRVCSCWRNGSCRPLREDDQSHQRLGRSLTSIFPA